MQRSKPHSLSIVVTGLMLLQSVLGLALQGEYRDVAWIKAAWFGNDWVTLIVAVPLMTAALILSRRGSQRGALLRLGMLGYASYNAAYYLFGTALNSFFVIYLATFVVAVIDLILSLSRMDAATVAAGFRAKTPARLIGGYLVFVAVGLTAVWLGMWAAHIFGGQALPTAADAFQVVAAIDLALLVPVLAAGGVLLWRRQAWGYVLGAPAGCLGSVYLLVLAVNSTIQVARGLQDAPGEVPIWGTLGILTLSATGLLLANLREE